MAYVGNKTTHAQLISVPDNVPEPAAGAIQARRPFPQWGQFYLGLTSGIGNYNALQAKVEKRFSHGFQMLASYTYSRCMDIGSNQGAPADLRAHVLQSRGVRLRPAAEPHGQLGLRTALWQRTKVPRLGQLGGR